MPLSKEQFQQLIVIEIGDSGIVEANMDLIWTKHEGRSPMELRYLFTKRDGILMLMGSVWADINQALPSRARLDLQGKFQNLQNLLHEINAQIDTWLSGYGGALSDDGTAGPVVDYMENTATVEGYEGYPDPNDPYYRGDPTAVQVYPFVKVEP